MMTLEGFRAANPQLISPPFIKCELLEKVKTMDLSRLNEKIHSSNFLMSRQSLTWVLNNYEGIIAGTYDDYKKYSGVKQVTAVPVRYSDEYLKTVGTQQKKYSKEELKALADFAIANNISL